MKISVKTVVYKLFCLIEEGKKPDIVKYDDEIFEYNKIYKGYFDKEGISLFSKYYISDVCNSLNNEIEIVLERARLKENDDWENLQEIDKIIYQQNKYASYEEMNNDIYKMIDIINDLTISLNKIIKNQNKIIEKLEEKDE